jgi:hypothetical protein
VIAGSRFRTSIAPNARQAAACASLSVATKMSTTRCTSSGLLSRNASVNHRSTWNVTCFSLGTDTALSARSAQVSGASSPYQAVVSASTSDRTRSGCSPANVIATLPPIDMPSKCTDPMDSVSRACRRSSAMSWMVKPSRSHDVPPWPRRSGANTW